MAKLDFGSRRLWALMLSGLVCCNVIIYISTFNSMSQTPKWDALKWIEEQTTLSDQEIFGTVAADQESAWLRNSEGRVNAKSAMRIVDFEDVAKSRQRTHTTVQQQTENYTSDIRNNKGSPSILSLHPKIPGSFPHKQILLSTQMEEVLGSHLEGCEISSCTFSSDVNADNISIIVVEQNTSLANRKRVQHVPQQYQSYFIFSRDLPGYSHSQWKYAINSVDTAIDYSPKFLAYYPWGVTEPTSKTEYVDYAKNKTYGAYAYVSHCVTAHYDRLNLIKRLSEYIDVDIYGTCTYNTPCESDDVVCETTSHWKYKFKFVFEDALCKGYITKQFWRTLATQGNFVPVVVGGLSVEEYTRISPPNSFIHVYNFSSIEHLGQYLRQLMVDDAAYNRYHHWKSEYKIIIEPKRTACELCKIAHNITLLQTSEYVQFFSKWNGSCRSHDIGFTDVELSVSEFLRHRILLLLLLFVLLMVNTLVLLLYCNN